MAARRALSRCARPFFGALTVPAAAWTARGVAMKPSARAEGAMDGTERTSIGLWTTLRRATFRRDDNEPPAPWTKWARLFLLCLAFTTEAFSTPLLGLINLMIIGILTRPKERSIYPWLRRRQEEKIAQHEGELERLGAKLNPVGKISSVEVHNFLLFNVASATTLVEELWLIGILGDWWLLRSSSRSMFFAG